MKEYTIGGKAYTVHPLTIIGRQQAFKDALIADAYEQVELADPTRGRSLEGAKRIEAAKAWLLNRIVLHDFDYLGPTQIASYGLVFGGTIAVAISLADKVGEWPALLPQVREWRKEKPDEWDEAYTEVGVAAGFFLAPADESVEGHAKT